MEHFNPALSVVSSIVGNAVGRAESQNVTTVNYKDLLEFPFTRWKIYHDDKIYEALKESIATIGLQQPIIVQKKDDELVILAGHHRARIMNELGRGDSIPAFVLENITDDQALYIHLDTNGGRAIKNMAPSELTYLVNKKMELIDKAGGPRNYLRDLAREGEEAYKHESGTLITSELIARETGLSPRNVWRFVRLSDLETSLMEFVDAGNISVTAAAELSFLNEPSQQNIGRVLLDDESIIISIEKAKEIRKEGERTGRISYTDTQRLLDVSDDSDDDRSEPEREPIPQPNKNEEGLEEVPTPNITLKSEEIVAFFPDLSKKNKKVVTEKIMKQLYFMNVEIPHLLEYYGIQEKRADAAVAVRDALAAFAAMQAQRNHPVEKDIDEE